LVICIISTPANCDGSGNTLEVQSTEFDIDTLTTFNELENNLLETAGIQETEEETAEVLEEETQLNRFTVYRAPIVTKTPIITKVVPVITKEPVFKAPIISKVPIVTKTPIITEPVFKTPIISRFPIRFPILRPTPCYQKSICAYYCPLSSNVLFMDIDMVSTSNQNRGTYLGLYQQNCVNREKAQVDTIIDNAIQRYVNIMFYQIQNNPSTTATSTLSADNLLYPAQFVRPLFYFLPGGLNILALTNAGKLSQLRQILINFVSQDSIKHICEDAQINNGQYTPSAQLSGLWNSYWHANSGSLSSEDVRGLNITSLGDVVILQTVSAFSARCNCSDVFATPLASVPAEQRQSQQQQQQSAASSFSANIYQNYCPKRFYFMLTEDIMARNFNIIQRIGVREQV